MKNTSTNSLNIHLTNLFSEHSAKEAVPKNLKDEVFKTIEVIQLLGDLTDLFTIKFPSTKVFLVEELGKTPDSNREKATDSNLT